MSEVSFTFPLPPNRANARGNWRRHHFGQKAFWTALDERQGAGLLPGPPARPWGKVYATVTLYVWGRMDTGNALNRVKWIEDWLVSRGYVVDDSEAHFEYRALPRQVIDRKNQRVTMTLEVPETES